MLSSISIAYIVSGVRSMKRHTVIINVRVTPEELARIDAAIAEAIRKPHHYRITRSGWIRSVVAAHLKKYTSRKNAAKPTSFVCQVCGKRRKMTEVACFMVLLDGSKLYHCTTCEPQVTARIDPPL